MPSVPMYKSPTIAEKAIPTQRFTSEEGAQAAGSYAQNAGRVGQANDAFLGQVERFTQEQKKIADDTVLTEAMTNTTMKYNELLYGSKKNQDGTQDEPGAFSRKGKDSFNIVEEYQTKLKSATDEIAKGLTVDQRGQYEKIRANFLQNLNGTLEKHVFAESNEYQKQTLQSAIAVSQQDAVLNFQAPGKVAEAINFQTQKIEQWAEQNGVAPETKTEMLQNALSKTHSGVIARMTDLGQDINAQKYFEANKKSLDAPTLLHLEKALEEGSTRGFSQRFVDKIVDLNSAEAIEKIRSIKEPKLRDATMDRYKSELTIKKNLEDQRREETYAVVINTLEQTRDFSAISPSVFASLSPEEKVKTKAYYKNLIEGVEIPRNSDNYYYLRSLATTPGMESEFRNKNLLLYKSEIHPTDLHELIDIQMSFRGKKSSNEMDLDGIRTKNSIVDGMIRQMGIDPSPKPGSKDATRANQFRRLVDEEVAAVQAQTGKKITNPEVEAITTKLGREIVTKKRTFWFDEKKRVFELTPENIDVYIPPSEFPQIDEALRATGREVNDANRLELYRLHNAR